MNKDHSISERVPNVIPPPEPEESFLAIGDLHGAYELLFEIDQYFDELQRRWPVVFLGDYVDRGEHSREVLETLMEACSEKGPSVICLMGNHEQMLLDFLDDPVGGARRWLRHGGLQTLASFGVPLHRGDVDESRRNIELRDRLAEAMGPDMIGWLRDRPFYWRSGNVWLTHAGANPSVPVSEQSASTLLWGHREFLQQPRQDGQWVVHGHTVVDAPYIRNGRIGLDTGAYATGRLSAAAITKDDVAFFQTGSSEH